MAPRKIRNYGKPTCQNINKCSGNSTVRSQQEIFYDCRLQEWHHDCLLKNDPGTNKFQAFVYEAMSSARLWANYRVTENGCRSNPQEHRWSRKWKSAIRFRFFASHALVKSYYRIRDLKPMPLSWGYNVTTGRLWIHTYGSAYFTARISSIL